MMFYWYNDTNEKQSIYCGPDGQLLSIIEPQTGDFMEIGMPEGKCLFVKQWPNGRVFVSHIDQEKD